MGKCISVWVKRGEVCWGVGIGEERSGEWRGGCGGR